MFKIRFLLPFHLKVSVGYVQPTHSIFDIQISFLTILQKHILCCANDRAISKFLFQKSLVLICVNGTHTYPPCIFLKANTNIYSACVCVCVCVCVYVYERERERERERLFNFSSCIVKASLSSYVLRKIDFHILSCDLG